MVYKQVRHLGAVYAEMQAPAKEGSAKRWFQVDREDGETFIWIGRFHCILTPWRRLVASAAAVWGFITGVNLGLGLKSSAAAILVSVTVAEPVVVATSSPLDAEQAGVTDRSVIIKEALLEWVDQHWASLGASGFEEPVTLSTSE